MQFHFRDEAAEAIICPRVGLDGEEDIFFRRQPEKLYDHLS
jgi:hypothetical protein